MGNIKLDRSSQLKITLLSHTGLTSEVKGECYTQANRCSVNTRPMKSCGCFDMSHTFPPPGSLLAAERSASSAPCGRSPAHGTGRRRGTALGDHSRSNPLSSLQSPSG